MGSIFKDGSRWRGQTTINGKRKSVSGSTKKEVQKKLAELLGLYFGIEIGGGIVKPGKAVVEPQLDRVILREKLLTRITTLIIESF